MSIILDKVNYIYEPDTNMKVQALKDISLSIKDGEFIGLIGHTGSGKSTLIQMFNGLLKPTSGNIYYNGADINDEDYDRKALRGEVGLVFQYPEHQLFEETVFKDVCFGPKNLGLSQKDAELRAFEALEKVKLPHELFDQSPFDLSGGQKRRAAIAGVLAMKPKMMILDEPAAGLDPKSKTDILNMIADLRKTTNATIILVSHSMEDVAEYVDRLLVMNKGELFMDGTPREVFTHLEELENVGLSAPEVTYVVRELKAKGFDVDITATTIAEACDTIIESLNKR